MRVPRQKIGWLSLALLAAAIAPWRGAAAADPVRAEVARLARLFDGKYAHSPEWKDTAPRIAEALAEAQRALDAGYVYRGLEQLGVARFMIRLGEIEQAMPAKVTMSQLEVQWRRAGADFAAVGAEVLAARWEARPAALHALAESAANKASGLLASSRAFGAATKPEDGLDILAQARGQAELARFYSSVTLARPGAPLALRSVEPELRQLQRRVDDAFKPPRSIELHPQFIRLNATLKAAGELAAAHRFAGALYSYLDALEQLALLDAAPPDAAAQARLRETLAAQMAEVARSTRDDSILRLFLERGESAIAGNPAPGADGWKQAAAIAGQVVPAYRAALAAPPTESKVASAHPVTVTLVRWPFT